LANTIELDRRGAGFNDAGPISEHWGLVDTLSMMQ
jgi:hypothetical protein